MLRYRNFYFYNFDRIFINGNKIIRKDRVNSVEKSMAERQQKRTENIQARITSKKNKVI